MGDTMDLTSQRLSQQQADHAAVITALRAVRERLRGQRICARTNDPDELARAAFMLIDITVAVLLQEGQAAGRTEDQARAAAIRWLETQAGHAEIALLESGAVFNPDASVLKLLATNRRGLVVAALAGASTPTCQKACRGRHGCGYSAA
jgi:hypothetical protein